jgi:single-stranded DNA-binding protein
MPEYEKTDLIQIAGNVAADPAERESSKGAFVSFRVGVNREYGSDRPDATRWYGVTVNDQQLQDFVMKTVRKGTPVVLEGWPYTTEFQGIIQDNLNARRVGIVDWFVKSPQGGTTARRHPQEDEDL